MGSYQRPVFTLLINVVILTRSASNSMILDNAHYKSMAVTIEWPEVELGVMPGRGDLHYHLPRTHNEVHSSCALVPSWIAGAQFGVIATGSSSTSPHMRTDERVYTYECPTEEGSFVKIGSDYLIPREFILSEEPRVKRNKIVFQHGSSKYTIRTNAMDGIGAVLNELLPKFHTLAALKNKLETLWDVIIRELYVLTLVQPVAPTKAVMDAYLALPSQYDGNEPSYTGFYTRVGTDFNVKTVTGGFYIRELLVQGTGGINMTHGGSSFQGTNMTSSLEIVSAGAMQSKEYNDWSDSLAKSPVPMWLVTRPLSELLDPHRNDSVKYDSFLKGRLVEQGYQQFKKETDELLYTIPKDGTPVQLYVRSLIRKQLGYIKPHAGLLEMLQTENSLNPNFHNFHITCHTKGTGRDVRISLMTGPCFTFPQQTCYTVTSNVDIPMLHFEFFYAPNCAGKNDSHPTKKRQRFDKEAFKAYRSLRLVNDK